MKYERRSKKDGTGIYYSFITSDRKRLTREEIRNRFGKDIVTEDEAEKCLKLLEAKYELQKLRIEKRLNWQNEYYNFNKLLETYLDKQKESAPNSWKNNEFYLRHYVLFYFLQEKKLNNIDLWVENYEGFYKWLEKAKTVKSNRPIAVHSRNHAIKALNTFMEHLFDSKIISEFVKCKTYGQHLVNERSVDDVIMPDEMERVFKRLKLNGNNVEAIYFRYLYFSGMRFNEGLCISLGDLYQGEIENDLIRKKMKTNEIEYFGYIVSDGQFGGIVNNKVSRLPFKGKKKIEEKFNRVIPIVDKMLWNELVEIAELKFKEKGDGVSSRDLLLFQSIDDSTATVKLQKAFKDEKLKYRSWHCLRHSRATLLIGETGDIMLARIWLGHSSPKTIDKYNHIYQAITRSAKANVLTGKKFGLKKV